MTELETILKCKLQCHFKYIVCKLIFSLNYTKKIITVIISRQVFPPSVFSSSEMQFPFLNEIVNERITVWNPLCWTETNKLT